MYVTSTPSIIVRELERQGFTAVEITRFQQLKAICDSYREYCESNGEHDRLRFLKWRYAHGGTTETTTA